MKQIVLFLALTLLSVTASAQKNIYGQKVRDAEGKEISLKQYKGRVLLIVNTATQCGFTPQYAELQKLYERYHDRGFEVLDFPCNQFGGQAPGTISEIHAFCTANYQTAFSQFDKVEVNGPNAAPLFRLLKRRQGFKGFGQGPKAERMDRMMRRNDPDYARSADIKWNFTKFLVDRKGRVVARFEPTHDLAEVEQAIQQLIL